MQQSSVFCRLAVLIHRNERNLAHLSVGQQASQSLALCDTNLRRRRAVHALQWMRMT